MADALTILLAVADAACEGRPAPPEAGREFCEAVDAFLNGVPLERALRLVAPGKRRPATLVRLAQRDAILPSAASKFFAGLSVRKQGEALATAWRRHAAIRHHRPYDPESLAAVLSTLLSLSEPLSAARIARILARSA